MKNQKSDTKNPKSEPNERTRKLEMISDLSGIIDRNTTNINDVKEILLALMDCFNYFQNIRFRYRGTSGYPFSVEIREVRKKIQHDDDCLCTFDGLTDDVLEAILIAGSSAHGLILVSSQGMKSDISNLCAKYNKASAHGTR